MATIPSRETASQVQQMWSQPKNRPKTPTCRVFNFCDKKTLNMHDPEVKILRKWAVAGVATTTKSTALSRFGA